MSILKGAAVLCLVLFTLPIAVSADGDTTSFKVTSYIPVLFRDVRWTITGNADISGAGNHNSNAPGDNQYGATGSSRRRNFAGSTDWRKTYVTWPLSWNLGISGNFTYNAETSVSGSDLNTALRRSLAHDSTTYNSVRGAFRLYGSVNPYLVGKLFLTCSGDLSVNLEKNYDEDEIGEAHYIDSTLAGQVTTEDRTSWREANATTESYTYYLSIGVGWGRVYFGNYAATALYMIDELRNHGQLKSLPDHSVMDSLAGMIYQYRMAHAIDYRVHRIEALAAIAAFLRAHGVSDVSDPIAGLYLQDVWDYFPSDSRPFGFIVKGSAGVRDSRSWRGYGQSVYGYDDYRIRAANTDSIIDSFTNVSNYSTSYRNSNRTNSPLIGGSISYFRPISLRTQLNVTATANYYLDPLTRYNDLVFATYQEYDASGDVSLDYIFSSRTRARLGANVVYQTYQSNQSGPYLPDDYYYRYRSDLGRFTLLGNLQYRIAIPTTVNATMQINTYKQNNRYYDSQTPRSTGHDYTLSISITHALY